MTIPMERSAVRAIVRISIDERNRLSVGSKIWFILFSKVERIMKTNIWVWNGFGADKVCEMNLSKISRIRLWRLGPWRFVGSEMFWMMTGINSVWTSFCKNSTGRKAGSSAGFIGWSGGFEIGVDFDDVWNYRNNNFL